MDKIHFKSYGLSKEIQKGIDALKYTHPTTVQASVIPEMLGEKDLIVKSQTGSGKTAAFAIPICEMLEWEENKPQALILTPTRELAMQVKEDFFHIGRFKRIKVVALYGKAPFASQQKALKQKTHIVVGTPGRVIDHLERGTWSTEKIRYVVIDEADEMLKMGFIEQIETIMSSLPNERVTLLFSATMPEHITKLCKAYMKDPMQIEIPSESVAADKVEQMRYAVGEQEKLALLKDILIVENPDSCMIFCNTKVEVDKVEEELRKQDYTCLKIHGGMEQQERFQVMEDFRKGYFRYLIATDVAARGIDIDHITHVINYDLPEDKESYVHRIGRTGRANKTGKALSFVTPRDSKFLKSIHEYIDAEIPIATRPTKEKVLESKEQFQEKMATRIKVEQKAVHNDIMKLHINAGKKTKMRPVDIVGTLCNIEGMTAEDIGIINVLDVSTFVEILNNKGEMVLDILQQMPIKGRVRKVTKADR